MATIGTDVQAAKSYLEQGDLVAIPTETVYGLAGNAYKPEAIAKIFEAKNRPAFDPLIVHTHSLAEVQKIVRDLPEKALILAERFWPGPLTLLLPKQPIIPDLATSGMDTVAVRIPQQPLTLELLRSIDFPLVAPSANPFGYVSPTTAQHVEDQLGQKIPYILDGGNCSVGIESTIVGFDGNDAIIHRLGGTSREKIESAIGRVKLMPNSSSNPKAPGMLKSHYSPGKKVVLGNIQEHLKNYADQSVGILAFDKAIPGVPTSNQIILAEDSNLATAAKNLFSALRIMDKMDVDVILAERVPEHGLGLAINDRLTRAAAK
ncbi:TsaC protein [Fulvivirga imtechensis AK7]|uniref:Threonylcarbamoyl-AMP synthase n=1 Tax=Fulvivirga imtechensis AK7 TaxID=1237149 RepID=L8JTL5_9BACT|nr:L-threonylcarbamoyladenylate synthase [Fulvivirga imtechensis]ELR72321.1 TsaC protein [Fulvivirga imtechensis AK7]